jgi:hypothetical protein
VLSTHRNPRVSITKLESESLYASLPVAIADSKPVFEFVFVRNGNIRNKYSER